MTRDPGARRLCTVQSDRALEKSAVVDEDVRNPAQRTADKITEMEACRTQMAEQVGFGTELSGCTFRHEQEENTIHGC